MVSLIRGLFGQALKTNDYLQFAILSRKSGNGSGIRPRMTVRDWKNASDGVIAPMIYLAVGGPVCMEDLEKGQPETCQPEFCADRE